MTAVDGGPTADEAVFFDVDGTLARTTIVHHYAFFRRAMLPPLWGRMWYSMFLLKCLFYLVLDRIDRNRLNVVFYRSYSGMPVAETKALVDRCYRELIEPRLFREAIPCIKAHHDAGRAIVLVTGSVDFIMAPLATALNVDAVLAPSLVESNGRFTGELDGPPVGREEKARRVRRFCESHGIDPARCHAYGDSIADLPMLEVVGHAHVVNPDRRLESVARARGWPVHRWTTRPNAAPRVGAARA